MYVCFEIVGLEGTYWANHYPNPGDKVWLKDANNYHQFEVGHILGVIFRPGYPHKKAYLEPDFEGDLESPIKKHQDEDNWV